MNALMDVFINEIKERSKTILFDLNHENKQNEILRELHTLKGTSKMMGFDEIGNKIHEIENFIKKNKFNNETKKIIRDLLEKLPVLIENNGDNIKSKKNKTIIPIEINDIYLAIGILTETYELNNIKEIRDKISASIRKLYNILLVSMNEILKNIENEGLLIAEKYNKEIKFNFINKDVKIDKNIAEDIIDIIISIIRNAITHGIEAPNTRIKKGKNKMGNIEICTVKENDYIKINIRDDGKGLYNKQLENLAEKKNMKIEDVIFEDFVSSKNEADEISGRGMGLSSVKSIISAIGGEIKVKSEKDKFTEFTIFFPFTLLINYYYIFNANHNYFAIKKEDIINVSYYNNKINVNNLFNISKGIVVSLNNGENILFEDFLGKVERHIHKLPDILNDSIYKGWFTFKGKPCLAINLEKLKEGV